VAEILPPGGFSSFPISLLQYSHYISWSAPSTPVTSYVVEVLPPEGITISPGYTLKYAGTAAFFEFEFTGDGNENLQFSIRAINGNSISPPVIVTNRDVACFPMGSKVATVIRGEIVQKNIEEVCVGDSVIGAFGEINTVLALQRVYVGKNKLVSINGVHITTDHHPHVTPSKEFKICGGKENLLNLYGHSHQVFDGKANVMRRLEGLSSPPSQLQLGDTLKTLEGSLEVVRLEEVNLSEEDVLCNLVVSGSHTYHVDNFAVTGWPSEKDYDYLTWTPKKIPAPGIEPGLMP